MVQAEVAFSTGTLRQPGVWGKLLQPPDGIYDINLVPNERTTVRRDTTTTLFPNHPEGLLLLFGIRGYQQAGQLTSCYILLRTQASAYLEWQFGGHLARFSGKEVALLAKAENDLTPLYQAIQEAGFEAMARLQEALRKDGKDPGGSPKR